MSTTRVFILVLAALAIWPPPSVAAARWTPGTRTTWQIQFSGRLNPSIDATTFDLDMFDTAASTVTTLLEEGVPAGPVWSRGHC